MSVRRFKARVPMLMGVLLGLLVLTACAGIGRKWEAPRISLANIEVRDISFFETVFQVELRVYNTNDVPLSVKGFDCRIALNDRHFATGLSNSRLTIPAYETATIPIVVYSSVLDVVKGAQGLQEIETLTYRVVGKVRLASGFFDPSVVPFESQGEIALK